MEPTPYGPVDANELLDWLKDQYDNVKMLEDGTIICTTELFTTRAIIIGLDRHGWEKRFCFSDRALCLVEFAKIMTGEDEPTPGTYIAHRGIITGLGQVK